MKEGKVTATEGEKIKIAFSLEYDEPASEEAVNVNVKCMGCKRNLRSGAKCDTCGMWFHFKCGKLQALDRIILHVGTHDLKRRRTEYIMEKFYELVNSTKKKFPKANVVISGILRRPDVSWKKIGRLNQELQWVAESCGSLFVDGNSSINDRDFSRDGLHLNQRGAVRLSELFSKVTESFSTRPDDGAEREAT
ncbi:uncharacterized protein [Anabrus simplex]|uniref:uncharacterized protein n=1 Tax=Anabrus simplex TaxID=316456 RepID=UPI0035A2D356